MRTINAACPVEKSDLPHWISAILAQADGCNERPRAQDEAQKEQDGHKVDR